MNDLIAQARRKYLAANPVRITDVPAHTLDGTPTGTSIAIPNLNDFGIVGGKLGMEYLAICHDEDAVEEWIHVCMGIVKDPMLSGILFANVFRGMNIVVGSLTERNGLREHLQRQAVDAWTRDFSGDTA